MLLLIPLAARQNLTVKLTFPVPGHLHQDLSNPLEREMAIIRPIAMIPIPLAAFIRPSSKKISQLHLYQFGKILACSLPNLLAHHLKKSSWVLLDTLAKLLKLCYAEIDFHRLFLLSFRFFDSNPILRERAFFSTMFPNSHNKFYTAN